MILGVIPSPLPIEGLPPLAKYLTNIGNRRGVHILVLRVLQLMFPVPVERAARDTPEMPGLWVLHEHIDKDVVTGTDSRFYRIAPGVAPEVLVDHGVARGEGLLLSG